MWSGSASLPIIIRFRRPRSKLWSRKPERDGLTLVTTEKDLVRLRGGEGGMPPARDIVPFAVTLEFDDVAGCVNSWWNNYPRRARRNHRAA